MYGCPVDQGRSAAIPEIATDFFVERGLRLVSRTASPIEQLIEYHKYDLIKQTAPKNKRLSTQASKRFVRSAVITITLNA